MLNEVKIFFSNIKNFRLLNEGVSEGTLVDAINNREYVYLYYNGDEKTASGNRTVRPMVLGKTETGDVVLRAWQDKGRSYHFSNRSRGNEHDYWNDNKYDTEKDESIGEKAGWRLFRVDKIGHILPIGHHFIDNSGNVMIPPKYNENGDKQMTGGIIAQVKASLPASSVDVGKKDEPNSVAYKVDDVKPNADNVRKIWRKFAGANKEKRQMVAADIEKLWNIARKVHKKSVNDFFIAIDNRNNYHIRDKKIKDKLPPEAVVGDLTDLYNYFFNQDKTYSQQDNDFARREMEKFTKDVEDEKF